MELTELVTGRYYTVTASMHMAEAMTPMEDTEFLCLENIDLAEGTLLLCRDAKHVFPNGHHKERGKFEIIQTGQTVYVWDLRRVAPYAGPDLGPVSH